MGVVERRVGGERGGGGSTGSPTIHLTAHELAASGTYLDTWGNTKRGKPCLRRSVSDHQDARRTLRVGNPPILEWSYNQYDVN